MWDNYVSYWKNNLIFVTLCGSPSIVFGFHVMKIWIMCMTNQYLTRSRRISSGVPGAGTTMKEQPPTLHLIHGIQD